MQECRLKKKKKKIKCKIFLGINPIPAVMTYSTALRFLEEGLWWYKSDLLAAAPQAWSGFTWHQRGLSSSVHPFLRATSPGQTRFILLSCGLSMFVWWTDWLRLKKKKQRKKNLAQTDQIKQHFVQRSFMKRQERQAHLRRAHMTHTPVLNTVICQPKTVLAAALRTCWKVTFCIQLHPAVISVG